MSDDLIRQKARERRFLEQLLDSRKLENYTIPVPIKAELRKYQQVGGFVVVHLCRLNNLNESLVSNSKSVYACIC